MATTYCTNEPTIGCHSRWLPVSSLTSCVRALTRQAMHRYRSMASHRWKLIACLLATTASRARHDGMGEQVAHERALDRMTGTFAGQHVLAEFDGIDARLLDDAAFL